MKKTAAAIFISILLFLCAVSPATACPYIETSYGNALFSYVGGSIQVNLQADKISYASESSGDKLVKLGTYLTIYNPAHTSWDFKINQAPSGSYTISNDPLTFQIQRTSTGGSQYLRGNMTEMSLDPNTGSIVWGTITDLQISNTIGSATLDAFSDYNGANITEFTFHSVSALQQWISNPSGTFSSQYSLTLTAGNAPSPSAAPEPAEWILLITGLMLMGGIALRRAPSPAIS